MTTSQATEIVRRLHAAYPPPPLTPDRTRLLIDEIALLHDPDVAAEATRGLIRNSQYFPKISEFRAAYHAVAARQRDAIPKLEEPRFGTDVPRWVQVWTWARWMRDPRETRPFPHHLDHDPHQPGALTPAEYEQLEREWAQAGSPRWKPTEILRTAGIAQ